MLSYEHGDSGFFMEKELTTCSIPDAQSPPHRLLHLQAGADASRYREVKESPTGLGTRYT